LRFGNLDCWGAMVISNKVMEYIKTRIRKNSGFYQTFTSHRLRIARMVKNHKEYQEVLKFLSGWIGLDYEYIKELNERGIRHHYEGTLERESRIIDG